MITTLHTIFRNFYAILWYICVCKTQSTKRMQSNWCRYNLSRFLWRCISKLEELIILSNLFLHAMNSFNLFSGSLSSTLNYGQSKFYSSFISIPSSSCSFGVESISSSLIGTCVYFNDELFEVIREELHGMVIFPSATFYFLKVLLLGCVRAWNVCLMVSVIAHL